MNRLAMTEIKRLADAYRDAYLAAGGPQRGNIPRQAIAEAKAVRAVLKAMREPSEELIAAGMAEQETDLASEWRAMIDHLLEEK
jgi:hypothetical protein